ncbi:MAG: L-threonine 3-dehydrogenase [Ancrocorticia populi]|uniref:L-threonine 3-dehydrogenase n=2 Tax=Ancrocorticia populi TaxID=2175228 RepID=UPI003F934AB1
MNLKGGAMRALVKPHKGPGLELRDVPEPHTGRSEVKIRVLRTGLCGTDLHIESWDDFAQAHVSPGQIIGHEFYGEIVEVGASVPEGEGIDELHVGQRISVEGHVVCRRCSNCRRGRHHMCLRTKSVGVDRDGAFADYVVVPARNVWVQPDEIDPDLGALFDPFGNAVHTAFQYPLATEDVLISGARPIGTMAAAIAQQIGGRQIVLTDINPARLELASGVGVTTVNVAEEDLRGVMAALGIREGFDVGLEMSGSPAAMAQMIELCNFGANIAMLGLPSGPYSIDWNTVITRMLTLQGVYGRMMFDTWFKATNLLTSFPGLREQVRSLITHRLPAQQWQEAFDIARSGSSGKVIMDWSV